MLSRAFKDFIEFEKANHNGDKENTKAYQVYITSQNTSQTASQNTFQTAYEAASQTTVKEV